MDFESALEYLEQFVSYEKLDQVRYDEDNFNLQRVRDFLAAFGVDYSKIIFVHVAGSKGKGSTCTMIAKYLWAKGEKAGLYTSPHILSLTERFQINGEEISRNLFALYVADLKNFIEKNGDFGLTYFELLTVLALKYFSDQGVKYAVMEVGLGGRLDATNVISPVVTVLTSVEKEHVQILGEKIEDILDEKLGIMKKGVPMVVGFQSDEVLRILHEKLRGIDDVYFVENEERPDWRYKNGAVALKALELLLGYVDNKIFIDMVENFKMLGRFDVRSVDGKIVVFDMAHTPASIKMLTDSLKSNFPDRKFVFLVSVLKDKQVREILDLLSTIASEMIFTVAHRERGISETEFAQIAVSFAGDITFKADASVAFVELLTELKKDQVLVVTGSNFLVGKILSLLKL